MIDSGVSPAGVVASFAGVGVRDLVLAAGPEHTGAVTTLVGAEVAYAAASVTYAGDMVTGRPAGVFAVAAARCARDRAHAAVVAILRQRGVA